jgi:hypothetical protein
MGQLKSTFPMTGSRAASADMEEQLGRLTTPISAISVSCCVALSPPPHSHNHHGKINKSRPEIDFCSTNLQVNNDKWHILDHWSSNAREPVNKDSCLGNRWSGDS